MKGIIVAKTKSQIVVENDFQERYLAKLKGNLKLNMEKIAVGDYVDFFHKEDIYLIEKIYNRKNFILRPKIANLDHVYIVQSTIQPNFNLFFIDKMLIFYQQHHINVSLIITKTDISFSKEIKDILKIYQEFGIEVYISQENISYQKLKKQFEKKEIVCFVGNSGVGKSTLLNKLDNNLNLKTQEISFALNRGKHTTTSSTLYNFLNTKIIDSPGFSSIELKLKDSSIAYWYFYSPKYQLTCKFNDCLHINEKGCAIKELLLKDKIIEWRYKNYLKFIESNKND